MNIVILHYHLNRGGVTQVIFNHLMALNAHLTGERVQAVILCGGRHDAWLGHLAQLENVDVAVHRIPALDYDWSKEQPKPQALGEQIEQTLRDLRFDPRETIVHAHNSSLGLNVSLPGALLWLLERGYRVLFQIHDFAEDFRPFCFKRMKVASGAARKIAKGSFDDRATAPEVDTAFCYPQAPHAHYAVINRRDHETLLRAGIPADRLHLLANPVADPDDTFLREAARNRLNKLFSVSPHDRYVLYPVRCIRRKNLGEAILWSAVSNDGTTFGFTLPPENATCASAYETWKRHAGSLDLPCRFEVGGERGMRYPENVAAADLILTTSLVEGFGMVYLESWLTRHMLAGRDLPEITSDFIETGLELDVLRPTVTTPIDWIGESQFGDLLRGLYERVLDDYGVDLPQARERLKRRIEQRLDDGVLDFGEVDEELQAKVIERIAGQSSAKTQLQELNPWMVESLAADGNGSAQTINSNADAVRAHYGFAVVGRRLADLYKTIASCEDRDYAEPLEDTACIVTRFLDGQRFRPIAT